MHIIFGWEHDGALWAESTCVGTVVTGPVGLGDILATRLGMGASKVPAPLRIARYRGVVQEYLLRAAPWFAESFRHDAWATARELLAWRDELVGAGWEFGQPRSGVAPPERLAVLADIEQLAAAGGNSISGRADVMRGVSKELARLVSHGEAWDLQIEQISLDLPGEFSVEDLPGLWSGMFTDLQELGVDLQPMASTSRQPPELQIVSAPTEWEAATVGARVISDLMEAPFVLIAGADTNFLDEELLRHGAPRAGARDHQHHRPPREIVQAFLEAITAPQPLASILEFLDQSFADPEGGEPVRIVTRGVRGSIHSALSREPGVGGEEWQRAVARAKRRAVDNGYESQVRLIDDLDHMISNHPLRLDGASEYRTKDVLERLGWLSQRLLNLMGRQSPALREAVHQVQGVTSTLAEMGERITEHELLAVINECKGTSAVGLESDASETMTTVDRVGKLGAGRSPVVWWMPLATPPPRSVWLRPQEEEFLLGEGVRLEDGEVVSRLQLGSRLRTLRRQERIIVILPEQLGSEPVVVDPVLTFLIRDLSADVHDLDDGVSLEEATEYFTVRTDQAFPANTYQPEKVDLPAFDPIVIEVPAGEQLLPVCISYTAWELILGRPIEWVLERQLRVRPGDRSDLPTGARMVGLWLHRVVENIVNQRLGGTDPGGGVLVQLEEGEVDRELTKTMPFLASELLLPGRERELSATFARGRDSIEKLFHILQEKGIKVLAAEARIEGTVIPEVTGAGGAPMVLTGNRDLDVLLPDGRPGVIDLKNARPERYEEALRAGTALQLAIYAKSVAPPGASADSVPTAYFMLREGELLTAHEGFGVAPVRSNAKAYSVEELWARAVSSLKSVLERLGEGEIYEFANMDKKVLKDYRKTRDEDPQPAAPYQPEVLEAFERVEEEGYYPAESYRVKCPQYLLITEPAEVL